MQEQLELEGGGGASAAPAALPQAPKAPAPAPKAPEKTKPKKAPAPQPKKKKGNRSAASPEAAPSVASEPAAPVELRLPEAANAVGRVIFLPSALLPPGLGPAALAEVARER